MNLPVQRKVFSSVGKVVARTNVSGKSYSRIVMSNGFGHLRYDEDGHHITFGKDVNPSRHAAVTVQLMGRYASETCLQPMPTADPDTGEILGWSFEPCPRFTAYVQCVVDIKKSDRLKEIIIRVFRFPAVKTLEEGMRALDRMRRCRADFFVQVVWQDRIDS